MKCWNCGKTFEASDSFTCECGATNTRLPKPVAPPLNAPDNKAQGTAFMSSTPRATRRKQPKQKHSTF